MARRIVPFNLNFGILASAFVSRRAVPVVFFCTTPSATDNRCDSENSPIFLLLIIGRSCR